MKLLNVYASEGLIKEGMDRCDAVNDIIEVVLLKHTLFRVEGAKEIREKIIKAQELIGEVYQELGNEI